MRAELEANDADLVRLVERIAEHGVRALAAFPRRRVVRLSNASGFRAPNSTNWRTSISPLVPPSSSSTLSSSSFSMVVYSFFRPRKPRTISSLGTSLSSLLQNFLYLIGAWSLRWRSRNETRSDGSTAE